MSSQSRPGVTSSAAEPSGWFVSIARNNLWFAAASIIAVLEDQARYEKRNGHKREAAP
jgi:hypothetical protein